PGGGPRRCVPGAAPAAGSGPVDAPRRFIGSAVDTASWGRALEHGRFEMRSRVLDRATRRPLPASIRLERAAGRLVRFDSLARGRVTFVAFWSRRCGPSLAALPALGRLTARLRR